MMMIIIRCHYDVSLARAASFSSALMITPSDPATIVDTSHSRSNPCTCCALGRVQIRADLMRGDGRAVFCPHCAHAIVILAVFHTLR